jgi:hypothetical protein
MIVAGRMPAAMPAIRPACQLFYVIGAGNSQAWRARRKRAFARPAVG